jgi:hypothetical protein
MGLAEWIAGEVAAKINLQYLAPIRGEHQIGEP